MPQHIKTYWRTVIVARLLAGNTGAGTAIYTNHKTPNSIDDVWINVQTEEETRTDNDNQSSLSGQMKREQRYQISVNVRNNVAPDDKAEEICGEIETLLLSDEFLLDSAYGVDYEGSTVEFSDKLEKTTLVYSMTFTVLGMVPRANPFYTG